MEFGVNIHLAASETTFEAGLTQIVARVKESRSYQRNLCRPLSFY
jgi:hypothetical protein